MTIESILPFSHRQIEPLAVNQGRHGRHRRQIKIYNINIHFSRRQTRQTLQINKILYNLYTYECQNHVIINYII